MKTFRTLLPACLLAGIFIYSCGSADRRSPYNNEPAAKMDSVSGGFENTPRTEQETGPGFISGNKKAETDKQNRYKPSTKNVSVNNFYADQTEINNNEYQNFVYMMRSTAARPTRLDSTHRFIRTADLKFRVKNVAWTSYHIEDIAVKFGGYISDTKLSSNLTSSDEKPVSADSTLQTMRYIVNNTIVLRVPVENLDTTLKSLVPFMDYLDYRNVNTNDITLEMLANRLAQARIAKFNQRLSFSIDNKAGKLNDVQSAEESMLGQQENSDNALIENLRRDDQVKYSTVTLNIYQPETIRQELVAREKNIDLYEPGLGSKLGSAFSAGWHGLQILILGIVTLWPLWLIALVIYYVVRRLISIYNKKGKAN
jgi:hypothetical protein